MGILDYLKQLPPEVRSSMEAELDTSDVASSLSRTTAPTRMYVDGDNGDDANSGLTWDKAKRTPQAGHDALPYAILHNSTLHIRGTFTDQPFNAGKYVAPGVVFVIDHADGHTVLESGTTTSGSTGAFVEDTTKSWTNNQWYGYWIKLTSGDHVGKLMVVRENDSDTLTAARTYVPNVGAGVSYEIVEPRTTYTSTGTMTMQFNGFTGGGDVWIQHAKIDGSILVEVQNNQVRMILTAIQLHQTGTELMHARKSNLELEFAGVVMNTDTYSSEFGSVINLGVSQIETSVIRVDSSWFQLQGSMLRNIAVTGCMLGTWTGFRVLGGAFTLTDVRGVGTGLGFQTFGGLGFIDIDGVELNLVNSSLYVDQLAVIRNSPAHGIEAVKSYLVMGGNVQGTGNTLFGVYARDLSLVETPGAAPTVTGSSGDLTLDGSTPILWASGLPAVNTTSLSRAT
jgi:hypothetical protein